MSSTSHRFDGKPYELIFFDVQESSVIERLLSERAAWGENADVEMLDSAHAVLIVRAGGAARIAERRAA